MGPRRATLNCKSEENRTPPKEGKNQVRER